MYKSRQKIIGVSIASCVVLGGFAVGTWAIIDSSNKMPKGNALVAHYQGITQYLGNGSLDVSKMSISDWINLNYPTKLLIEGVNQTNYSIYYFTTPQRDEVGWTNLKDPSELLKKISEPSSPLICKVDVSETTNSYSYKVNLNSTFIGDSDPLLASVTYTFSDSDKKSLTGFNVTGVNIEEGQEVVVENNVAKFTGYDVNYSYSSSTDKVEYKMNVSSVIGNNNTVYTWEMKTTPSNQYSSFDVIHTGASNVGIFSRYNNQTLETDDAKNSSNYKIYNISHQEYNNGTQGNNFTRQTYQSYWKSLSDSEIPQLHLPNSIGLASFLPPLNKTTS